MTSNPPDYRSLLHSFMNKYEHPIALLDEPCIPETAAFAIAHKLIEEEAKETLNAMEAGDVVEIADGLADLLYVVWYAALVYGIPLEECFREVHYSNMSKSTEKNEYGKTQKGPDFKPPNLRRILLKHGWGMEEKLR